MEFKRLRELRYQPNMADTDLNCCHQSLESIFESSNVKNYPIPGVGPQFIWGEKCDDLFLLG